MISNSKCITTLLGIVIGLILLSSLPLIYAEATCQAPGDIAIYCNSGVCDVGVGNTISNISIKVTPKLGNVSNRLVQVFICKYGKECYFTTTNRLINKRYDFRTDSTGTVLINQCPNINCIDYLPTSSGNITLQAYIPDFNSSVYLDLGIKKSLELILTCNPSIVAVGRKGTCTWKTLDTDTQTKQTVESIVVVQQGDVVIAHTPGIDASGLDKLEFIAPDTTGSIDITVTAKKTGYISTTETFMMKIVDLSRTQYFYIDNKEYPESYQGTNLLVGNHDLKLNVKESGSTIAVSNIDATIKTPSGKIDTITFVNSGNDWSSSYNFAQAGQSYTFSGRIQFVDAANKEDLLFEYNVVTAASAVEDYKPIFTSFNITLLIGSIVIVIVLVIIGGMYFRKKRK